MDKTKKKIIRIELNDEALTAVIVVGFFVMLTLIAIFGG